MEEERETTEQRKQDHIELAFRSRVGADQLDDRFWYEPMLGKHPDQYEWDIEFLGKSLRLPLWVSSMTGGTRMARTINHNLARACGSFGMGMGLGSCRSLLYSDEAIADFDVRHLIGDDLPLYGNLGVAQIEQLIERGQVDRIRELIDRLRLDGVIVHINPLQEAFQPEGDRFVQRPVDSIRALVHELSAPIIVKEVGQGMGPASLRELLQLPLAAVDFAASGGTNFALLEVMRRNDELAEELEPLVHVGHNAMQMVDLVNGLKAELGDKMVCKQVIISGGVRNFLDGYYLINKLQLSCIYGQASAFLKHAMSDYESLHHYVETQAQGLALAQAYLRVK